MHLVFKYILTMYLVFKYISTTYLVFKYISTMYLVFKYIDDLVQMTACYSFDHNITFNHFQNQENLETFEHKNEKVQCDRPVHSMQ